MVPSPLDRRWRGLLSVLAGMVVLLCLQPGYAAKASTEAIDYNGKNFHANINAGTLLLEDVELRQAPDTLIRAAKGDASGLVAGKADNSRWILTAQVHIEFNGAILDSDDATVVFANGSIQSIQVNGKPALFSHPAKIAGQRNQGRAETITFDGIKRLVRLTGHTWYSFPPYEGTAEKPLVYNLDTSEFYTEGNDESIIKFTMHPDLDKDKHVPTPRTPNRSKAQ